jgi:uncharacterized protein (TIGR03382 family)
MTIGSLLVTGVASADLQGISIDSFDSGFGIGLTHRVYVDVDAGDQVNAIFGDSSSVLDIHPETGSFYQNMFGYYSAPNESLFDFFPSVQYDSFVTIGLLTDTDNAMLDIGIDWTDFETNGGAIWADNGTWFATPDDAQVFEQGGRVLIGQFTGAMPKGYINILGKNADINNTSWQYSHIAIPAPGAIAVLGLAGLLGVRRRK